MSWQNDYVDATSDIASEVDGEPIFLGRTRTNSDVSQFDLGSNSSKNSVKKGKLRRRSLSSTASTVRSPRLPAEYPNNSSAPLKRPEPTRWGTRRQPEEHRGVLARAAVDTTLAVIPAEAFSRLTKKFPKATSHIVQGIISKKAG